MLKCFMRVLFVNSCFLSCVKKPGPYVFCHCALGFHGKETLTKLLVKPAQLFFSLPDAICMCVHMQMAVAGNNPVTLGCLPNSFVGGHGHGGTCGIDTLLYSCMSLSLFAIDNGDQ